MPHVPPAWRRFAFVAVIAGFRRELPGALLLVLLIALPSALVIALCPPTALPAASLAARSPLGPAVAFPTQPTKAVAADAAAGPLDQYRCEGDPLSVRLMRGAVDDPAIPDPSAAPVPVGGFAVLRWRELSLQLPRTNNAGPASFTDGRWWWSLEDPAHPRFRLRRALGDVQDFRCEPA